MDDQAFNALISGVGGGSGADQSAVVKQLRGQHDLGTLYSMSPTLGGVGDSMKKQALASANQIGDRRQQGLTRTRQAEQDVLKLEQRDYDRNKWTDVQTMKDEGGDIATYGRKDSRGPLIKIPDSEGLTPYKQGYASSVFRKMNLPGMPNANFRMNDAGQIQAPDGRMFENHAEFAEAFPDLADIALKNIREQKFTEGMGTGTADEVTELRTGLATTNAGYSSSADNMLGIINSLEQGANPGQIYALLPTLTDATSLLESIVSKESLDLLNTYQLKPVSDADMAILRQVASPKMSSEALMAWAKNKHAVLIRAQASGRVFEDWVAKNERVPRGEERTQLQAQMLAAADAAGPSPGQVKLSTETDTEFPEGPARPTSVTQAEWDQLTPSQKIAVAEKFGG